MRDVRVYELANFFLVPSLKDYAFQRFSSKLKGLWITEGFIGCVKHVYSVTSESDEMRGLVADVSRQHLSELWKKPPFQELIREGGDFAVDLTARSIKASY